MGLAEPLSPLGGGNGREGVGLGSDLGDSFLGVGSGFGWAMGFGGALGWAFGFGERAFGFTSGLGGGWGFKAIRMPSETMEGDFPGFGVAFKNPTWTTKALIKAFGKTLGAGQGLGSCFPF